MSKDHWSSQAYNSAAGFVPKLTTKVVSYLDAQPHDRILDIGCGDGSLTATIARTASEGTVLGLDNSQSFIATARERYSAANCTFQHLDCTNLDAYPDAVDGSWDRVFSNAAMHWILRRPETRAGFFHAVYRALRPGGVFVFEMGGHGNVAEVQAAAISALLHAGLAVGDAVEASPWFCPSTEWMREMLAAAGFEVEVCEAEYRPTNLTPENRDRSGGLEGWVRLMCAEFIHAVDEGKRDQVTRHICSVLDPLVTRPEDGSKWVGYRRLRAVARKK